MLEVITVWFLMTAGTGNQAVSWMPTNFPIQRTVRSNRKASSRGRRVQMGIVRLRAEAMTDLLTEFAPLTLAVALYAWWCWRGVA